MITALLLGAIAACGLVKQLGKNPKGKELARLDTLPSYKNGRFENLAERSNSAVRHNRWLFSISALKPSSLLTLPWVKGDLKALADGCTYRRLAGSFIFADQNRAG